MSGKTVFISYRRDSIGKAFAGRIFDALRHHGYDVFLDVDNIVAGKWEQQILKEVSNRAHFILVITPGSIDRCESADDWMRREFELALSANRNIVPVCEESLDLANFQKGCPESMSQLFSFQILVIRHNSFQDSIEELIRKYVATHLAPNQYLSLPPNPFDGKDGFKNKLKLFGKTLQPLVDYLLTFLILISVILELLSATNYYNGDFSPWIVITICFKGFWNILALPKDIRLMAQVALVLFAIGSSILVVKAKTKEQFVSPESIVGFAILSCGCGMAIVITKFKANRD